MAVTRRPFPLRLTSLRVALVLTCAALPSCASKGQSYREAVALICESPQHVPAGTTTAGKGMAAGRWIETKVHNPEARKLVTRLIQTQGATRVSLLRREADRADVPRCALADYWQDALQASPQPPAPTAPTAVPPARRGSAEAFRSSAPSITAGSSGHPHSAPP